jgi:hypothetical protein
VITVGVIFVRARNLDGTCEGDAVPLFGAVN